MIDKKDIIADMHTHTIASLHAYSTLYENLQIAKQNGIKYLGVTDHYFTHGSEIDNKNTTSRLKYMEERINLAQTDIITIGGAEFNINQEIPFWDKIKSLKWRPIGLHSWFVDFKEITLDDLYHFFEQATERHNAFAHIERELNNIDHKRYNTKELHPEVKNFFISMCDLAKKNNVFLELNECSFYLENYEQSIRYWLEYAKYNRNLISMGTDAHFCMEVGKFTKSIELLQELNYPKELILNCNKDMLESLKGL